MPEAKSDVGVLYVPGVGPDDPTEDLQRLADTVALWLDDWLSEGSGAAARTGLPNDVDWVRSHITADSEQPAHTVLSAPLGTVGERIRLTIAVSRWQSTLGKPGRRTVAIWLIWLMPMLVLEHFHAALFQAAAVGRSRRVGRLARVVVSLAAFLAALPLAAVLLTVLLVIAGISYLPLPGVGAVARAAETWLARKFGYSLALSESPTRLLSAVDVAATELGWLADRCCRVVVVGFSQGTVVAHEVIRRRAPVNLALFATVGSALRTFYEMPLLASGRSTYWRTLGNIVVVFPFIAINCVMLPILVFSHRPANIGELFGSMGVLLLMALYGSVGLALLADVLRAGRPLRAAHRLRLPGAGQRFTWVEYAATADPIPQGALIEDIDAARFGGWPVFMSVSNEAALWRDHRLYWANRDEFLPDLIRRILTAGGVDVCQPGDDELLERARRRRAARVTALSRARLIVAATAVAIGIRLLSTWTRLGTDLLMVTPDPLRSLVGTMLKPFAPLYPGKLWAARLIGLLVWAGLCIAVLYVTHLLWLGWQARDVRRLFARQPCDTGGPSRVAFSLLIGAIVVALAWAVTGNVLPDAARALLGAIPPLPPLPRDLAFVAVSGAVGVWVIRRRPGHGDVYKLVLVVGILLLAAALLAPFHFHRWAVDLNVRLLFASLVGIAVGVAVSSLPGGPVRRLVALVRARLARVPKSAPPAISEQTAECAVELVRLWHGDSVNALVLAADGRLLSGSSDTTTCLWPSKLSGDPVRFYDGKAVTAVAMSTDGATLVTGGRGRVVVRDARTGRRLAQLQPYGRVTCVAVSPKGNQVLVGGEDGVALWPLSGDPPKSLSNSETLAAAYVPGGLWLATAKRLLFRPDAGPIETVHDVYSANATISSAAFAADGDVYVLNEDGTYLGRRSDRASKLHIDESLFGSVNAVAIDPAGHFVAIADSRGTIQVWSLATKTQVAQMRHSHSVRSVTFGNSGDGDRGLCRHTERGHFDVATGHNRHRRSRHLWRCHARQGQYRRRFKVWRSAR